MNEKIVICLKCGGSGCYETIHTPNISSYQCINCGFQSQTNWKEDEEDFQAQFDLLPQVYQDLKFVDLEGKIWVPTTLNFPARGCVFLDGPTKDETQWAGILAVEIPDDQREKFPNPLEEGTFYKYKMDHKTLKHFDSFVGACVYIGLFGETINN